MEAVRGQDRGVLRELVLAGAAGLASMQAALDRGDLDEAARQGALAGPTVIADALRSPVRATQLAGIASATSAQGRAELLEALADVASAPDRRVAIPAAAAARDIARGLAAAARAGVSSDDYAPADYDAWRARWAELALRGDRWIELRVLALDTTFALAAVMAALPSSERVDLGSSAVLGLDPARALNDPDPAFVLAAQALGPPAAKALAPSAAKP